MNTYHVPNNILYILFSKIVAKSKTVSVMYWCITNHPKTKSLVISHSSEGRLGNSSAGLGRDHSGGYAHLTA